MSHAPILATPILCLLVVGYSLAAEPIPSPTPVQTPTPDDRAPSTDEIQALVKRVIEVQVESSVAIDELVEAAHPTSP